MGLTLSTKKIVSFSLFLAFKQIKDDTPVRCKFKNFKAHLVTFFWSPAAKLKSIFLKSKHPILSSKIPAPDCLSTAIANLPWLLFLPLHSYRLLPHQSCWWMPSAVEALCCAGASVYVCSFHLVCNFIGGVATAGRPLLAFTCFTYHEQSSLPSFLHMAWGRLPLGLDFSTSGWPY